MENIKHKNIILFGAPGAGKSTIVEKLKEASIPFSLVSLGQVLREMANEDSDEGRKIKEIMAKGDLLDDFFITEIVKSKMRKIEKDKSIILDGYPRSLGQLNVVDSIFEENELELPVLVYIKISQEEAVRRLSGRVVCSECKENFQEEGLEDKEKCKLCGGKLLHRDDDRPEAIQNRFELFEMQFDLIKHYFESRNRYFEIDGSEPKEKRLQDMEKIMA